MRGSDSPRSARGLVARYLACYLLWAALSALGLWVALAWRAAIIALVIAARVGVGIAPTEGTTAVAQVQSVDQLAVIALVLLWLGGAIWLEGHLRTGVARDGLWSRAARTAALLVVLLGLANMVSSVAA